MTEQEFIDLTDSQKLVDAYKILSDIVPDNSSVILNAEYHDVMGKIQSWKAGFESTNFIDD